MSLSIRRAVTTPRLRQDVEALLDATRQSDGSPDAVLGDAKKTTPFRSSTASLRRPRWGPTSCAA